METIIKFKSKELHIKKLQEYLENVNLFFKEYEKAVPLLKRYFKDIENELKLRVILLLGLFAKEKSGRFCYQIAMDVQEDGMVRDTAALQLGHILRCSINNENLQETLLMDLKSEDKNKREYAIRALGFEGNQRAALPIVELLYDPDPDIQECAVNALANLRCPSVVTILKNQLEKASEEEVKTILFNLWRFEEQKKEIIPIYLNYIKSGDPELRFFSLIMLNNISNVEDHLEQYSNLIIDNDKRIRKITAELLGKSGSKKVKPLLNQMLEDEDMEVKKAVVNALKDLKQINPA